MGTSFPLRTFDDGVLRGTPPPITSYLHADFNFQPLSEATSAPPPVAKAETPVLAGAGKMRWVRVVRPSSANNSTDERSTKTRSATSPPALACFAGAALRAGNSLWKLLPDLRRSMKYSFFAAS